MKPFVFGLLAISGLFASDISRGIELYKEGKYSEAESEFRSFVAGHNENARARRFLGVALIEQKKFDQAADELKRAAELEPGGESKGAIARLYAEKKEFDRAKEELDGATGDDAVYARALVQLDDKKFDDSVKNLETYLESDPNHAYAHYYAGMAYNGTRRKDKMLSHFEMFLRLNPDAPEARKVRAVLQTGR